MTGETSTGMPGGNTWDIEFQDYEPDDETAELAMQTVHELRRTPKGRKILVQTGVSMKGYARGKGYRSLVPFTERRFVAWDGESIRSNIRDDFVEIPQLGHRESDSVLSTRLPYERSDSEYVLFGNSDGRYIHGRNLSTVDCLSLLTDHADRDAIHIGFAFGYDVNMIVKDLSKNHLRILKDKGSVLWKRWRLEYLPRKWFVVTDRLTHRTTKIWDVFSFFMCSAVDAWEQYGVEVSDIVIRGKEERGDVPFEKLWTDIFPYWKEENDAYVSLMDKLREALHAADLYISSWHGPGAIASHSLQKHRVDRSMDTCPEPVSEASQYAYGGGRFEMFAVGRANVPVYEYDINSAYPYAISQLPDFSRGEWAHVLEPTEIARFGVYRVSLRINPFDPISNFLRPMPFFHRDKRGLISFPCNVDTWVWSPELWGKTNFPGLTIHEGWVFNEATDNRPFDWLAANYEIRKRYKAEHNPAQLALKLQMNSMYGKMAQRVGWNEEKRTAPKWHQLEWAGWVTSYCRGMVFRAALLAGSDLVAFETDAVFSLRRLMDGVDKGGTPKRTAIHNGLDIGSGLGQWEETIFDDFVYLQSGCRFGLRDSGDGKGVRWHAKYRGFDKGSLTVESALAALSKDPDQWAITGTTKRFIGFAQALHTDFSQWREFQSGKARILHIGGEGKRKHMPNLCVACKRGIPGDQGFHNAALANPMGGESEKHHLPWLDDFLLETQDLSDAERYEIVEP